MVNGAPEDSKRMGLPELKAGKPFLFCRTGAMHNYLIG
jgi:hypothetical protein